MPDMTLTPAEAQRRTQLLAQLAQALGIPTALGEGPGNGPHLAAARSEPAVGWSAKARAALELWEAHSDRLSAAAQAHGWAALGPEQKTQVGSNNAHMIVAYAILGVLDLIKGWAAVEDEPARDTFSRETEDGWGDTAITPKGSGESAWTEAEDLPWLRLALDHAILNDPDARFGVTESGHPVWVSIEDAARIATNWIAEARRSPKWKLNLQSEDIDLSNGCPTCGGPGEMRVNREADPGKERCTNCEHQMQFHQPDGCWFGMRARVGRNSACPCGVGRGEPGDGCICGRKKGEPGYGLLCPVHGDPISRKNLPSSDLPGIDRGGLNFPIAGMAAHKTHEPVLSALDRCEHGRHRADNCFSCPDGQSAGNLFLTPGTRIGTNLYGQPIERTCRMTRMAQDFRDWLEANNIPVNKTPIWPLLQVADDGSILIEQIWKDDADPENGDGEKVLHLLFRQPATYMARFPKLADMPAQLFEGYERQRHEAHIRMRAVHVLRELQPSPTIINVNAGDRLIFVTARELADGEGEAVMEGLKEILPDIMIRVVCGVDLITVNKAEEL